MKPATLLCNLWLGISFTAHADCATHDRNVYSRAIADYVKNVQGIDPKMIPVKVYPETVPVDQKQIDALIAKPSERYIEGMVGQPLYRRLMQIGGKPKPIPPGLADESVRLDRSGFPASSPDDSFHDVWVEFRFSNIAYSPNCEEAMFYETGVMDLSESHSIHFYRRFSGWTGITEYRLYGRGE